MNVVAILNSRAGCSAADTLLPVIRVHLQAALAEVHIPESAAAATELARKAILAGADVILAAGGDGTVNAVINGMPGSRAALAILPVGTANDLASMHGMTGDAERVCLGILRGKRTRIDLIDVNGWRYATDGGLGLCANVALTANGMRRGLSHQRRSSMLGSSLYPLAALTALARDSHHARRMRITGEGWDCDVCSPLLMINNQRMLGRYFPVSPAAENDDGLFDVCLVTDRDGRYGLLRLVGEVLRGKHVHRSDIHSWQARSLRVETDEPMRYLGDGELTDAATTFDVRILPSALRLVDPRCFHRPRVS